MDYNYKNLDVWKKSIDLTILIYTIIKKFPEEEKFVLSDQMKRAAISVPSNIAEGIGRQSNKETLKFFYVSRGSLMELETQVIIAYHLEYLDNPTYNHVSEAITETLKMLNSLISYRRNLLR